MPIDFNALLSQIDVAVEKRPSPVEHCQDCGGYIGDHGPRYARHNDECQCDEEATSGHAA